MHCTSDALYWFSFVPVFYCASIGPDLNYPRVALSQYCIVPVLQCTGIVSLLYLASTVSYQYCISLLYLFCIYQYCTSIVKIMHLYCTSIVKIVYRHCASIVPIVCSIVPVSSSAAICHIFAFWKFILVTNTVEQRLSKP